MGKQEEIRAALRRFAGEVGPHQTMLAKVHSVDEATCTCVLKDDDNEELLFEGVRLRPVIDGLQSITLFPKAETWALAARIEEDEGWMVIAAGEIDKVRIVTGNCTFEQSDRFLIQREDETLKKVLNDLMDTIKELTVNTNNGPSSTPINAAAFTAINNRINNLLK